MASSILFNHESKFLRPYFMSSNVSQSIISTYHGSKELVVLGKPFCGEVMWKICRQNYPDDFVLSTIEVHTVSKFTLVTFKEIGIDLEWTGSGIN